MEEYASGDRILSGNNVSPSFQLL